MKKLSLKHLDLKTFTCLHSVFIVLIVLASLITASDDVAEAAANTGFQFLEEPLNPRFIAMGTAGTALAGNGFSFYNPALPYLVDKTYLYLEYGQYPKADLKHFTLESSLLIRKLFFGLSLQIESIEDIFRVNEWGWLPSYDAPTSSQFTNISLDAGFTKWDNMAFAICVSGMQNRIVDEYAYAVSFSAGAVYSPIPGHLCLGLSMLNLGASTPMLGPDSFSTLGDGERLPLNSRFGVAWTDTLKNFPYTVSMDVVYRNVYDRERSFKRDIQDRFTVPFGVEIKLLPPLAIRMGKRFNHPTEAFNFGIGLNSESLLVDASFVIPKLVDDVEFKWLTSITYRLETRRKKDKE